MNVNDLNEIRGLLEDLVAVQDRGQRTPQLTSAYLRELEFRIRRVRRATFPAGYFSDFAWDILLELDNADRSGQRYAITDAGVEAGISLATTVRYINKLESDGYVGREADSNDRRRSYVYLTEKGKNALDHVFDRVVANTPAN